MKWTWCLVTLAMIGCDDAEELTCEVLADPNFCWNVAVTEAKACLADTPAPCEVLPEGTTCLFSDGIRADFAPPLRRGVSLNDTEVVTVTVRRPDFSVCALLRDDRLNDVQLQTASGSALVRPQLNNFEVECPDGTTYQTTAPLDLLSCVDGPQTSQSLPGAFRSGISPYFAIGPTPKAINDVAWISGVFP